MYRVWIINANHGEVKFGGTYRELGAAVNMARDFQITKETNRAIIVSINGEVYDDKGVKIDEY